MASADLSRLEERGIKYEIVDARGWTGEYYVISPRMGGPRIDEIRVGRPIYRTEREAIVRVDSVDEARLYGAGYGLTKITRVIKPTVRRDRHMPAFVVQEDSTIRNLIDQVSEISLEEAVQRLQDFQTRYTHSDSIIPAGQWIYDQYLAYGYTDVVFDTFFVNNVPHRNVVATKPGLVYPDSVIIIGGHFDSIVLGAGTNPHVWAPGADDNASGTVAAMEAARILADHDFEATIKFAAWDAEEVGLLGSSAYAGQAYENREPIGFYLNLALPTPARLMKIASR
jgi:hypothetical protein